MTSGTCSHTVRVMVDGDVDEFTGERSDPTWTNAWSFEDIDVGRYRCTQCGEVLYYTGNWRQFHTSGDVPTSPDVPTSLYEMTIEALSHDPIHTYPRYREWIEKIDPVLQVLGVGTIGRDTVTHSAMIGQQFHIVTRMYVRQCEQRRDMSVPCSVLRASDPVIAAKRFKLEDAIARTERSIVQLTTDMERATTKIEQLRQELLTLPQMSI